ncbi:hypothetical protein H2203_006489 [Taxawa tesnikishii (nom. ined.)]|nr:hypothetical protein H2203_006489 [Dothideales sp. JES 119]
MLAVRRCAPSYAAASRQSRFPVSRRYLDNGNEILPRYTCTVEKEGVMAMCVEALSPFNSLPVQTWREVYVVLSGTMLNIHKVKTTSVGRLSVASAGRLLRTFTLQHAEVGLASDVFYNILEPTTRLAHLIPAVARRKAFQKDPDLFRLVRQSVLRLRLEAEQFLLAEQREETIFNWINRISAGIDISLAIDERSIPRQCTVPRRRRRQNRPSLNGDLNDRRLIEEQEQILRDLYPAFASNENESVATTQLSNELTQTTTNEQQQDEEIDISVLAEDSGATLTQTTSNALNDSSLTTLRPTASRQTTSSTLLSTVSSDSDATLDSMTATDSLIDPATGKWAWAPSHPRTPAQQLRYIKRCMPVLYVDSPRASSVLMCAGKRVRINPLLETLEEWTLSPPSYAAHDFAEAQSPSRRQSASASASGDEIAPASPAVSTTDIQAMTSAALEKTTSGSGTAKSVPAVAGPQTAGRRKRNERLTAVEAEAALPVFGF